MNNISTTGLGSSLISKVLRFHQTYLQTLKVCSFDFTAIEGSWWGGPVNRLKHQLDRCCL